MSTTVERVAVVVSILWIVFNSVALVCYGSSFNHQGFEPVVWTRDNLLKGLCIYGAFINIWPIAIILGSFFNKWRLAVRPYLGDTISFYSVFLILYWHRLFFSENSSLYWGGFKNIFDMSAVNGIVLSGVVLVFVLFLYAVRKLFVSDSTTKKPFHNS